MNVMVSEKVGVNYYFLVREPNGIEKVYVGKSVGDIEGSFNVVVLSCVGKEY